MLRRVQPLGCTLSSCALLFPAVFVKAGVAGVEVFAVESVGGEL